MECILFYRHVDSAVAYQNEAEVGEAVRKSGLKREDVFISESDSHTQDNNLANSECIVDNPEFSPATKLVSPFHGYDSTTTFVDRSLAQFGFSAFPLLLLSRPRVLTTRLKAISTST